MVSPGTEQYDLETFISDLPRILFLGPFVCVNISNRQPVQGGLSFRWNLNCFTNQFLLALFSRAASQNFGLRLRVTFITPSVSLVKDQSSAPLPVEHSKITRSSSKGSVERDSTWEKETSHCSFLILANVKELQQVIYSLWIHLQCVRHIFLFFLF